MRRGSLLLFLPLVFGVIDDAAAQSLRGSQVSLDKQNAQALRHDFTYLRESSQLRRFVDAGLLVPLDASRNYRLKDVSFPYARPEVKLFIERFAGQYRAACGEQLVVTSLTRPIANQPRNASPRSVHPTGMALDLRRPPNPTCRGWLESTLLYLEDQGVLEATREGGPPHYHVAIFPRDYERYVASVTRRDRTMATDGRRVVHRVQQRDTLWEISRRYRTTPAEIRTANGLQSSLIRPGQVLRIPTPDAEQ